MGFIDLHTHSTASDGTDSPAELVEKAKRLGLEALALTDHDTLSGLDEAEAAANAAGLRFIRGCEISTRNELGGFHILGLWTPAGDPRLEAFLNEARTRRARRNEQMVAKLRELGIDISMEEILAQTSGLGGRPHMANLLLEKGIVQSRDEAFAKFLGKNGKAFVPKCSPDPVDAVRALSEAGATAVLAHPLLNPLPDGALEDLLKKLSKHGLSAVETMHSSHGPAQSRQLSRLAASLGLGESGGSDYHGLAKPGIELGSASGGMRVDAQVLERLVAMRKSRGLPC